MFIMRSFVGSKGMQYLKESGGIVKYYSFSSVAALAISGRSLSSFGYGKEKSNALKCLCESECENVFLGKRGCACNTHPNMSAH